MEIEKIKTLQSLKIEFHKKEPTLVLKQKNA